MFSSNSLPKSILEEVSFPAFPSPYSASVLAVIYQLENTQWWQAEKIADHQQQQLAIILNHANKTVPFFPNKFDHLFIDDSCQSLNMVEWLNIPIISRQELQKNQEQFLSENIPQQHLPLKSIQTSGSTGTPLTWENTVLTRFFQQALILRDHFWHKRDFSKKHGGIRWCDGNSSAYPEGSIFDDWNPLYKTGSSYVLNIKTDPVQQLEWITRNELNYLITYPSNALALAKLSLEKNITFPYLEELRFFGEIVEDETRQICQQVFNVPLTDIYSANEVGYIALQCPEHPENYHIQSESLYVEIIDDHGNPCPAGELGKVVLTSLHNFAKPLIRYAIGDYAMVGEPCPCGRGLPVLKKILGRTRNLLTFPSGERFWAVIPHVTLREIAPIRQRQFVQKTKEF